MRELNVPEPVRFALLKKIQGGETRGVVETSLGVYSFFAGKAPTDRDADVQSELERSEGALYILRARRALVTSLTEARVNRRVYHDEDALSEALYLYYQRSTFVGIQSASEVATGWIMALAWLTPEAVRAVQEDTPKIGALDEDYCSFLYQQAKVFFDTGRYTEALPVFKHIHDFHWANVEAYMDAAECFLRTSEPKECLKLLKELIGTLGNKMDSSTFTRAGRLFREAGDREAALSAFKAARERFRHGK